MIAARTDDAGLVRRLTTKARALAVAGRTQRWDLPHTLWPLFTGDRHA